MVRYKFMKLYLLNELLRYKHLKDSWSHLTVRRETIGTSRNERWARRKIENKREPYEGKKRSARGFNLNRIGRWWFMKLADRTFARDRFPLLLSFCFPWVLSAINSQVILRHLMVDGKRAFSFTFYFYRYFNRLFCLKYSIS